MYPDEKKQKWIRMGKQCVLFLLLCSSLYIFLSIKEREEKVLYRGRAGERESIENRELIPEEIEKGSEYLSDKAEESKTTSLATPGDAGETISVDAGEAISSDTAKKIAMPTSKSEKININTASAEELQSLKGIGPSTAGSIIAYREEYGGFSSIEEIMNVKRIGEKTFAKIKDRISVN